MSLRFAPPGPTKTRSRSLRLRLSRTDFRHGRQSRAWQDGANEARALADPRCERAVAAGEAPARPAAARVHDLRRPARARRRGARAGSGFRRGIWAPCRSPSHRFPARGCMAVCAFSRSFGAPTANLNTPFKSTRTSLFLPPFEASMLARSGGRAFGTRLCDANTLPWVSACAGVSEALLFELVCSDRRSPGLGVLQAELHVPCAPMHPHIKIGRRLRKELGRCT